MQVYLEVLEKLLTQGLLKEDRTGIGTLSLFGEQLRYDLKQGFPLLTTKKVHFKSIVHELLWFLKGDTNIGYLSANGVSIWDEWADDNGDLGPVYGKQWRSWPANKPGKTIDQISWLINEIKSNPNSRRMVISAWNPADIELMALPPCHCLFQFNVTNNKLSCQLYQRSADFFLGVPFNVASYALLTHLIARICHLDVGEFIHTLGDLHLYCNHTEQAKMQLSRTPRALPEIQLPTNIGSIFDFIYDDIQLLDYSPYPSIKAKVAV